MRYPIIEVGRYLRNGANSSMGAALDNSFDRARCTTSLVHPSWSPSVARNDLALCFFQGASRFKPVAIAQGARGAACFVWEGFALISWAARAAGACERARVSDSNASMPLQWGACQKLFSADK